MALAQVWTRLERRVEARELLAPVYGCSQKALTRVI